MQLRQLRIRGFRTFIDPIEFGDLRQINVLVGRNNTGKSNLVNLVRMLRFVGVGQSMGNPMDWVSRGAREARVEVSVAPSEAERQSLVRDVFGAKTELAQDALRGQFLIDCTHVFELGGHGLQYDSLTIPNLVDGRIEIWRGTSRQASGGVDLGWSVNLYAECQQANRIENLRGDHIQHGGGVADPEWTVFRNRNPFDALPKLVSEFYQSIDWIPPSRSPPSTQAPQEVRKLDPSGANLPQVWNTNVGEQTDLLTKVGGELGRMVKEVTAVTAPVRGNQVRPEIREGPGTSFDLANSSTGLQQLSIMLTKIFDAPRGSVLCIEEPELHLHPGAQRDLRRLIRGRSSDVQFFITTHASSFVESDPEAAAFLLTRDGPLSRTRRIEDKADISMMKTELGASNADLFGFDVVLFVEGESEEIAIPILARAAGVRLPSRGVKLVRLSGKDRATKLEQFLDYLHDSDTTALVVLDADSVIRGRLEDTSKRGFLRHGQWIMWPGDFEDLFSPEDIAKACQHLGVTAITTEQLKDAKGAGRTVGALRKLYHELQLGDFKKPELAEELARLVVSRQVGMPEPLLTMFQQLEKMIHGP